MLQRTRVYVVQWWALGLCLSWTQCKHSVPDAVIRTVKPGNLSWQVMHRDISEWNLLIFEWTIGWWSWGWVEVACCTWLCRWCSRLASGVNPLLLVHRTCYKRASLSSLDSAEIRFCWLRRTCCTQASLLAGFGSNSPCRVASILYTTSR